MSWSSDRSPDTPTAEAVVAASSTGAWGTLREAVRGSSLDYTTAPVGRAIVMLAVPMVMEMAMESIFVLADVFWVAHLGADAVATVGLTESLLTMIYTLAMGLSIGATAIVARRIGEHDSDGASSAAVQAIALGVVVSAIVGVAGAWHAPSLLQLMGASPEVIATGSTFTRVMLGGNATIVLLFLINAAFRGAGDAAIAMRVLWMGNAINIVLGPCLIFGLGPFPELGVTGAAVATNIGRGTAVLVQLYTLMRLNSRVRVARRHWRLDLPMMGSMLRLSGSGTLQILIGTASYVALVRILSVFGSSALAGYTIGIRLIIFALLPSFGISNAAATMVGQNLGAGHPERAERAVWTAAFYNMLFLGTVGLVFLLLARPIVRRGRGLLLLAVVLEVVATIWLARLVRTPPAAADLAALLDAVVVGLDAGLSFEQSLRALLERNADVGRIRDARLLAADLSLGVRRDRAFGTFAARGGPEARVAAIVSAATRLGAPLAELLVLQADALREAERRRAEGRARRLPILMMFPLTFCVLPALLIVFLGPPLLSMLR